MNNTLITVLGWEERSLKGFYKNYADFKFHRCIIYIYEEYKSFTDSNWRDIIIFCETNNVLLESINLNVFAAKDNWEKIEKSIKELEAETELILDITTVPRETIWTLLFFIKQKISELYISYHKPISYANDWLSREPDSPRLLYKHSGISDFNKPTLLFILTGFDFERTRQLIWYYEPRKTILVIQTGSQFDNLQRNNKENHIKECKGLTDYNEFEIDAYDDKFGYDSIKKILDEHLLDYNIIASSLGPKLSGISLYQYFNENNLIALTYVPCKEYNGYYSTGYQSTIVRKILL